MRMSFYKNKNVLVTGGHGLIGSHLVPMLEVAGARVTVADIRGAQSAETSCANFFQIDLRDRHSCVHVCEGQDIVFNLVGIKGSPVATATRPASFLVPTLQFSLNMMEAAREAGVKWYMYTSSVGVYGPAEIFHEDQVWENKPSTHDKFAGWAKRIGEMQAEAYRIEYGWDSVSIVRPANVYGPYDNFSDESAMVIPSLIKRVCSGENPLKAWGDGSPIRDFVHARDVARGMMLIVEKGVREPVNLGSGSGVSIRDLAETIASFAPNGPVSVEWDASKPNGDKCRLMNMERAASYGFHPEILLKDGIRETVDWYINSEKMVA